MQKKFNNCSIKLMKKLKAFLLLIPILITSTVNAERINGTSPVYIEPAKEKLFLLYDETEVSCTELKKKWYHIAITIRITKDQYEKQLTIQKGEKLINLDGKIIGETLAEIPMSVCFSWDNGDLSEPEKRFGMDIYGYIKKSAIKEHSIPENPLIELINKHRNHLKFESFEKYLIEFKFDTSGFGSAYFPTLQELMIYENYVDDPSPLDRITLIFEDAELIAIIHSRPLEIKNILENIDVGRKRTLTLLATPQSVDKKIFIEKYKQIYQQID